VRPVTAPAPPLSVPLVWAELITSDVPSAVDFYGAVLQWKSIGQPGSTDLTVFLDQARVAGPICGIRPRTPADPRPIDLPGPPPDRWSVRLAPPRPSLAADPGGDQLLRPRSPGPRIGRWSVPRALCFAELRTPDVAGARTWMERRLDAAFREADDPAGGPPVLQLESSFDPETIVAAVVEEHDPAAAGWALAVQVPDLDQIGAAVVERGGRIEDRSVPVGFPARTAATMHDPGGARIILVEHGPVHGRRG
jgi:predicted enzyme related to lactoylglutathione lyase